MAAEPRSQTLTEIQPDPQALDQRWSPADTFIVDLHRGPDGYITYATKRDGEWIQLGAAPVDQPWLPYELLETDAYVSINSSFRHDSRTVGMRSRWEALRGYPGAEHKVETPIRQKTDPNTGLFYAKHDAKSLRWLNAAYVDLDAYKVGLDAEGTLAEVLRRQESRTIPPASMIMRSGRGIWLFWLLLDKLNPLSGAKTIYNARHTPDTPQRASIWSVHAFARIQGEIFRRLADLGADPTRQTPVSFTRIPGSTNSNNGHAVEYWAQGARGRGFYYTLPQLADALGIPADDPGPMAELHRDNDRTVNEKLSAAGARGWVARWQNLLRDLTNLIAMRGGGFDQGCRNIGAFYLALALDRLNNGHDQVLEAVTAYGQHCRPALSLSEIRDAVKQGRKPIKETPSRGKLRNETVCAHLGVTDYEADRLETLKPNMDPAVSVDMLPPVPAKEARQLAIREIVNELSEAEPVPSCRKMRTILLVRGLLPNNENHVTISRDYHALGLSTDNRGGRPVTQQPLPV